MWIDCWVELCSSALFFLSTMQSYLFCILLPNKKKQKCTKKWKNLLFEVLSYNLYALLYIYVLVLWSKMSFLVRNMAADISKHFGLLEGLFPCLKLKGMCWKYILGGLVSIIGRAVLFPAGNIRVRFCFLSDVLMHLMLILMQECHRYRSMGVWDSCHFA